MNHVELKKIKQKAIKDGIPIIMDDTLETIKDILSKNKPKRILEIGSAVGYSAICFSEMLDENGCIDTIELDEEKYNLAKDNFYKAEVQDKINIFWGDAVEILPNLSEKYDVIFIDAAKSKYPIFLKEALNHSKIGTIILADNVLYKGYVLGTYNKHKQRTAVMHLREFLKEIQENLKLDTKILEIGDGLSVSIVKN